MREKEQPPYALMILGKESYTAMENWKPEDAADKNSSQISLKYTDSTLDDEISSCIHVYELEDIKKHANESTDPSTHVLCMDQ